MSDFSCINHPAQENLLILRKWQLDFCNNDQVAAGLISIFEYWHNIKYKKQLNKSIEQRKSTDLLQFHTEKGLINKLMSMTKTPACIRRALLFLQEKKIISIYKNPSKRYKFDRTRHFLFHPNTINKWLATDYQHNKKGSTKVIEKTHQAKLDHETSLDNHNKNITETQQEKIDSILKGLKDTSQQQSILNEYQQALLKNKVKNTTAYLTSLINRANKGIFYPTVDKAQEKKIPAKKPHKIHEIYPPWKARQKELLYLLGNISTRHRNFIYSVRAYANNETLFLRCPNIYTNEFIEENKNKISQFFQKKVKIYIA